METIEFTEKEFTKCCNEYANLVLKGLLKEIKKDSGPMDRDGRGIHCVVTEQIEWHFGRMKKMLKDMEKKPLRG